MQLTIRKAKLTDVPDIHRLVNHYAGERIMLPRTLTDLYENVWEFTVVAEEEGRLIGCGALKLYNQEVAEIRSLCVDESLKSKGIGRDIMEELLDEAEAFGLKTVFALTVAPTFFEKLGFRQVPRERFPTKVWRDCLRCERYTCCDEKAVSLELIDRPTQLGESSTEAAEVSS
jgi:amino-acid N-acetyltransferase